MLLYGPPVINRINITDYEAFPCGIFMTAFPEGVFCDSSFYYKKASNILEQRFNMEEKTCKF